VQDYNSVCVCVFIDLPPDVEVLNRQSQTANKESSSSFGGGLIFTVKKHVSHVSQKVENFLTYWATISFSRTLYQLVHRSATEFPSTLQYD